MIRLSKSIRQYVIEYGSIPRADLELFKRAQIRKPNRLRPNHQKQTAVLNLLKERW